MLLCIYSCDITWIPAFKWTIYLTSLQIAEVIFEPLMCPRMQGSQKLSLIVGEQLTSKVRFCEQFLVSSF